MNRFRFTMIYDVKLINSKPYTKFLEEKLSYLFRICFRLSYSKRDTPRYAVKTASL